MPDRSGRSDLGWPSFRTDLRGHIDRGVVEAGRRAAIPKGRELFITDDAGGTKSYRSHVWKHQLQRVADKPDLVIHVSHFPPGANKWNKVPALLEDVGSVYERLRWQLVRHDLRQFHFQIRVLPILPSLGWRLLLQ